MKHSNLFLNRLAWICFIWPLRQINSFPLHTDSQRPTRDEYFWFNEDLVIVISVVSVIASISLIFACLCCERGVFKVFDNVRNGAQREGYVGAPRGTEFTIFPPRGSDLDGGSLNDIKFEPLPDIRPRGGKTNSLRPKPASFCNVISRGLSVEDWFDDPSSNFPRNQLQYIQELGCGWFGQVVEGEAQGICRNAKKTKIVVKILREDATPTDQIYFLHEVKAFRDLNHPHVMRLLAKCLETDPFLIVLEHCAFKDLKTYLTQHRTESESLVQEHLLLRMMCNIASGLNHMHENNFVHTDLAARNCLVGADLLVKIGDYGNSIDKFKDDYYCAADMAVAIRWCAPETLRCTETTIETKEVTRSANIWSLGVVLWEILEFARMPYVHLHEEEVLQRVIVDKTEKLGQSATPCAHADKIFRVMQLCWLTDPDSRPRVEKVYAMLAHLFANCDSKKRTDFETRWNALQPQEIATVHNLSREVVEANRVGDANSTLFENNFISHRPPHNHRSSSLDFGENSSLSPSLQNLRGSLDELSAVEMTSTLSAETSLSDTNLNNAFATNQVSYASKPRSSSIDFVAPLSGKNVQREFDAWIEGERNKGDEASQLARQISDAMGTLDAALADEKCTSSEESNQTSPERELTAETKPVTSTSHEPVVESSSSEAVTIPIFSSSSLPESSAVSVAPDPEFTSTESSLTNGLMLTRDKSPSMQDFLKLTVIENESETSDSDGTQSINSEGATNQLPLTQLCTLPVVVTRDDVDGGVDDVGVESLALQFTSGHVDDEDVVDSIPTNAGELNLPDALSLTRVPNTSLENDRMTIQLDSTLNFRSRIKDDASDLDRINDEGCAAVATPSPDERTATTDGTNKYEENDGDGLTTFHCTQCRDEIGQLIEDLVQVTHAEKIESKDRIETNSEDTADLSPLTGNLDINKIEPEIYDDVTMTEIKINRIESDDVTYETSTDANEIHLILDDTKDANEDCTKRKEVEIQRAKSDETISEFETNEKERENESRETIDIEKADSKTDFVVVSKIALEPLAFENDSTNTMYEIDDIEDALANDSSDENMKADDDTEWTKITLDDQQVTAVSPNTSQIDNSLSEIGKRFTDLQLEFVPQETSDEEEMKNDHSPEKKSSFEITFDGQETSDEESDEEEMKNDHSPEKKSSFEMTFDGEDSDDVSQSISPTISAEADDILYINTATNEIYLLGDQVNQPQLMFTQYKPTSSFNSAMSNVREDESPGSTSPIGVRGGDDAAEFNLKGEQLFNLPTETTLNFASTSTVDDDAAMMPAENDLVKSKNESNERRVFMWPDSSDDEIDTKRIKSVKVRGKLHEWDSDSETSSSSTSGEFDCSKNNMTRRRSWSGEMYAANGGDEIELNESTIKVSTWDKDATPKRSSLKVSPVKGSSELKKSVSFEISKRPHIYKYPKEKQWEEPRSDWKWNLPQNLNYTDWELGDEEMPTEVIDFDDLDDETLATSTPSVKLGDQMLYKLSDISDMSDDYDSIEDNDIAFVDPLVGAITYRDLLEHYRSNQFFAPQENDGEVCDGEDEERGEYAEKTWATKYEANDDRGALFESSHSSLDAILNNNSQLSIDSNDVISFTDAIIHDEDANHPLVESTTGECNGNEIQTKSKTEQSANEELLI